jgi:polyphenol oxidase
MAGLSGLPGIIHGISNRTDCQGESLDLSWRTAESIDTAEERRARILDALGLTGYRLVAGRQVHGDHIEVIHHKPAQGSGTFSIPETDALITNEEGIVLFSMHADCVPVFLYEPRRRVIGIAHAGWKGTVLQIAKKTVRTMVSEYSVDPEYIHAAIGPSIGPNCYEVGGDVYEEAYNSLSNGASLFSPVSDSKWTFNMWTANWQTLIEAGLRSSNIELAGICTHCHTGEFFSHRAEKGQAGRFGAFLALT